MPNPRVAIREIAIQGTILLVLLAFIFPGTFFRGEMISPGALLYDSPPWRDYAPEGCAPVANRLAGDALSQFHLWFVLVRQSIDAGEWPLWNPTQLGGMPLLANVQSTPFYPPRLLHAFLDLHFATTLYVLLKMWLCGATAYLCARGLRLNVWAARFFSVAWMLSSYNQTWCYWPIPDGAAWFPVLFLGVEWLLDERYRRGLFTTALGGSLLLLAGHPETAFALGAGLGVYFFLRLAWERRRGRLLWMPVGVVCAAWTLALLTCAAVLVPFAEYLPNSLTFGSHELTGRTEYSYPLSSIATFWVPRFHGMTYLGNYRGFWNSNFGVMAYSGIAVWLALTLILGLPKLERRHRTRILCLLSAAALSLLMAFDIPALNAIKALPVLRSMWHFYFISFPVFAVPLAAAIALNLWFQQPRTLRGLAKPAVAVFALLMIPAVFYLIERPSMESATAHYVQRQLLLAGVWVLAGSAVIAVGTSWRRTKLAAALLTLILAADLLIAMRGIHPTVPRAALYPKTALTDYLVAMEQPTRLSTYTAGLPDELKNGVLEAYGLEQLWGYDGIYPSRMFTFLEQAHSRAWDSLEPLCAVSHYLFPAALSEPHEATDNYDYLGTFDEIAVYRNRRAFARAYLVGRLMSVPDTESLFDTLCAPGFDPSQCALTESPPPGPLPSTQGNDLGTARVIRRTFTHVAIDVDAVRPCVLVLADAYYPGWHARIDETRAEVFPVYHAFRAIIVPQGKHTVEYSFSPLSFRLGLLLSTVSLAASSLVALYVLNASREKHP